MNNTMPAFLVEAIKNTVKESDRIINEQRFNKCVTEQTVRNKRTKVVYSVIFDHGMGQYKLTPMGNSSRGVFYKPNLDNYELAGTGVKPKVYTRSTIQETLNC